MIEFHRYRKDKYADRLQKKLDDMVLAYNTVMHDKSEYRDNNDSDTSLPYLDENGTKYSDKEEIKSYLRELSKELKEQRAVSGDACYIDPRSGEIC